MPRFLTRDEWQLIRPALVTMVALSVIVSLKYGWTAAAIIAGGFVLLGAMVVAIESTADSDA